MISFYDPRGLFYILLLPGPSEAGPQGQATAGGTIGALGVTKKMLIAWGCEFIDNYDWLVVWNIFYFPIYWE